MNWQNLTYLFVDLSCIVIPLIASFYPKHPFYKEWKYFLPANFLIGLSFIIWDYFFTEAGIWGFNPDYLTGLYIFNLPIEEILFFIFIPYACVFTWYALKYLLRQNFLRNIERSLSLIMAIFLIGLAIISYNRLYTFITFLSTGIFLLTIYFSRTSLAWIYLSYLLIIPFFLASNGILTGSWIAEPIVWYNNQENLGIRIGTIPVEDSIYGFLLIALNIQLYKWIKQWATKKVIE
nr:lycopene cyclase domain-containing protein [uncultured Carboxylicivirga sp.]